MDFPEFTRFFNHDFSWKLQPGVDFSVTVGTLHNALVQFKVHTYFTAACSTIELRRNSQPNFQKIYLQVEQFFVEQQLHDEVELVAWLSSFAFFKYSGLL
jgi:hypothetical protein